MPDVLPLTGLTVVVTRPQQQGAPLADALRSAGASVIEYPVLEIVPLDATIPPATLARAAAVIFVSVNAVEHGLPSLRAAGTLSAGCLMMAIGGATATALHDAGIERVVSPQQNIDSEGLLALPQLQQVQGQTIILMRGHSLAGGRTLIERTLTERGATVMALECYERREIIPAAASHDALVAALDHAPVLAVMALSVETLESLMASLGDWQAALKRTALLVPHPRVSAAAAAHGFEHVFETPMSASGLIAALAALKPRLPRQGH